MRPTGIIVGFTTEPRDRATVRNFVDEPQPPGNYKNPDTIAKWRNENLENEWHKWDQQAAWMKATGRIQSIYAVCPRFESVLVATDEVGNGHCPATQFLEWVYSLPIEEGEFWRGFPGNSTSGPLLYGFDIKQFVRIAGQNAIREGTVQVPLSFWYRNTRVFDPLDMLREDEYAKRRISLEKLCAEAPEPVALPNNYDYHVNAEDDARIVTNLCLAYGLFPNEIVQDCLSEETLEE